jgi:5-methylcytosine-specific restriction endonuclease McrA
LCEEKRLKKTLEKYEGKLCNNCHKKKEVKNETLTCPMCDIDCSNEILKKYKMCQQCSTDMKSLGKTEKKIKKKVSEKYPCLKCGSEWTQKTLDKYGGKTCRKCHLSSGGLAYNSNTLRSNIWSKWYETQKMKCRACNKRQVTPLSFEKGHDVADSNGGSTLLENLYPICRQCNVDQGTMTFDEFSKANPPEDLKYDSKNYLEQASILRQLCVTKDGEDLSHDTIHEIASKRDLYRLFTDCVNKTNYILLREVIYRESFFGRRSFRLK